MTRRLRVGLATTLVAMLVAGLLIALGTDGPLNRTHVIAYFDNSKGIYVGDDVRILGIRVGEIDQIEPQGTRVKISFWYDAKYKVPAEAKAVILSPSLVPARAIQLTPAYTQGPVMTDQTVIPQGRTAVPMEYDDLRTQLEKLTESLQPTEPGGVSTAGALINTAADNLRGQGANMRQTITAMAQAFSAIGDHSSDVFSTVKNLSILVTALQGSADIMRQLNQRLASATGLLANDPGEVGNAVRDINAVVNDVAKFVADNREALGTTSDKFASISSAVVASLDDLEQTLHIAPNSIQNFVNLYQPAKGAIAGAMVMNMAANPIAFVCGAIQAASRLNAEQSAKLCVQYLAPIVKNRQYNFPPLGVNPFVGAMARPNEVTYSEDWMRPDHRPTPPGAGESPAGGLPPAHAPLAAEATPPMPLPAEAQQTNPADGLLGMMTPPGGGS
ncbi:MCE family protein [Mycobacterium deserti]|uniref:MCE family protein n=1 Tax=Mycobacterium deserti TaxID=2978347 RepID=A0ABT2MGN1_9MYCO|nr:MCE family protein [Mycobacterium deserti]MCT7660684.1 MCE family protein [Mycobacterium deserti]